MLSRGEILQRMTEEELFRVMEDLGFFDPVRGCTTADKAREMSKDELEQMVEDYTDEEDFISMIGVDND